MPVKDPCLKVWFLAHSTIASKRKHLEIEHRCKKARLLMSYDLNIYYETIYSHYRATHPLHSPIKMYYFAIGHKSSTKQLLTLAVS